MKTILVPTDFSIQSENALNFAAQIATEADAEILLLHTLAFDKQSFNASGEIASSVEDVHFQAEIIDRTLKKLEETAAAYTAIKIKTKLLLGDVEETIEQAIDTYDIHMLIMGSKGVKGWKEIVVGSCTEKIIRNVKCLVMVIKQPVELKQLKSILLATDMSSESIPVVNKVNELRNMLGLSLDVLYVNRKPGYEDILEGIEADMTKFLKKTEVDHCELGIISSLDVESGIMEAADRLNSGMIAMATHGRKGLSHILKGSLTEDIANHGESTVVSMAINK